MQMHRQSADQSNSTPFINIKERASCDKQNVSFDNKIFCFQKRVVGDSLVNIGTIAQKMEEDRLYMENDSQKETPFQSMIINDFAKISVNINTLQMEQWLNT